MSAARKVKALMAPDPRHPESWPVIWRVVVPTGGSYNHDLVMTETESEAEARDSYRSLRHAKWPVRLEKVLCGPLPKDGAKAIAEARKASPQNPGSAPRPVLGAWSKPARRRS